MAQKLTKVAEVTDLESTDTIVVIDESVQNPDGSSGAVRRIKRTNMDKAEYITVNGVKYPITSITKTTVGTKNLPSLVIAYDDGEGSTIVLPDATAMGIVSEDIYSEVRTKVSNIKVNGVTQDKDASGVVDITISDDTKADAIVKTASGSIASFSDGGDELPMKSLKVNIVPKQSGSGDPSPSNIRPISGYTDVNVTRVGKNLLDPAYRTEYGTNTIDYYKDAGDLLLKANTTYVFSVSQRNGEMSIHKKLTNEKIAYIYSNTVLKYTPTEDVRVRFNVYFSSSLPAPSGGLSAVTCQVEVGTEATEYEPYNSASTSYPISLGQTVYGGVLDVVSGNGDNTLRHIIVPNDTPVNLRSSGDGVNRYVASIYELRTEQYKAMENNAGVLIASKLTKGNGYSGTSPYLAFLDVGNLYFTVPNTMTDADASSLVRGMELVYELETPTEIQLTPTEVKSLLGANNVWSESGTVEVEYRADTTLAYNELLSLIASLS